MLMAIWAISCAKYADNPGGYDGEDGFPEANLIITGQVFDRISETPVPGIRVTLKSFLASDVLRENPVSTEPTTSGEKGLYLLRKRFNASVSSMVHTVEFMDDSKQYLPSTKEITIDNWSLLLTRQGYQIPNFNAFLDRVE